MKLGATTKCFGGMKVSDTAELFCSCGLSVAELCFCHEELDGWRYNFCGDSKMPSVEDVRRAVGIFCENGVEVSGIGIYSRFFGGGTQGLCGSVSRFCAFLDIVAECGINTVCTHGGIIPVTGNRKDTLIPEYKRLALEGFCDVCVEAKKLGITVAIEMTMHDIFNGYSGFCEISRSVSEYIGDDSMLKFIANSCEDDGGIPKERIAMYRLKDKSADGKYYDRIGSAGCDFKDFLRRHENCDIPMLLEFVNSTNLRDTCAMVRGV